MLHKEASLNLNTTLFQWFMIMDFEIRFLWTTHNLGIHCKKMLKVGGEGGGNRDIIAHEKF